MCAVLRLIFDGTTPAHAQASCHHSASFYIKKDTARTEKWAAMMICLDGSGGTGAVPGIELQPTCRLSVLELPRRREWSLREKAHINLHGVLSNKLNNFIFHADMGKRSGQGAVVRVGLDTVPS